MVPTIYRICTFPLSSISSYTDSPPISCGVSHSLWLATFCHSITQLFTQSLNHSFTHSGTKVSLNITFKCWPLRGFYGLPGRKIRRRNALWGLCILMDSRERRQGECQGPCVQWIQLGESCRIGTEHILIQNIKIIVTTCFTISIILFYISSDVFWWLQQ